MDFTPAESFDDWLATVHTRGNNVIKATIFSAERMENMRRELAPILLKIPTNIPIYFRVPANIPNKTLVDFEALIGDHPLLIEFKSSSQLTYIAHITRKKQQ